MIYRYISIEGEIVYKIDGWDKKQVLLQIFKSDKSLMKIFKKDRKIFLGVTEERKGGKKKGKNMSVRRRRQIKKSENRARWAKCYPQ